MTNTAAKLKRALCSMVVMRAPVSYTHLTAFVLKNKVGAADEHTLLPDRAGNPMRHQIIDLGVEFLCLLYTAGSR